MTNQTIDTSIFYNINKLMSYNALYSFCMGERGLGKTYAGKKKMIDIWLKNRKQSIYTRRTVTELDKVKDSLFNDIAKDKKYQHLEIEVKGYQGFIDGECFCYFIPLSTSTQYKSASFPDVEFIFFDEYILTKTGRNSYLKNEMTLLNDLVFTVFRYRKPTVYLCSNAVSFVNPFFSYFGIEPRPNDKFITIKNKYNNEVDVVVELTQKGAYRDMIKKTRFAQMLEGTEYGSYAIDNNTLEDSSDFIMENKPFGFNYFRGAFRVGNRIIGAWSVMNLDNGVWFGEKIDPSSNNKYTVYSNQNFEGWRNVKIDRNSYNIKYIKKCFLEGTCYYEKQEVKKLFVEEISKFL